MTSSFSDGTTVVTPILTQGYSASRASQNVFSDVLGRNYPDVTLMPAGLRTGTLTCLFATEQDAARFEAIHSGTALLTFMDTDVPTAAMTYVVDGSVKRELDPESLSLWLGSVDFREVRA